ncbi:hypothetical protein ACIRPQ_21185 [Streptomyces sp. NPDC101213]|uniref:hypothetical protein n=1 Tax=Streptomyces sp. NPDC101213 TaxID=3366130 RepID=UPI0037FBE7CC
MAITAHASASPTAPSAATTAPVPEKDAQAFADAAAKNPLAAVDQAHHFLCTGLHSGS